MRLLTPIAIAILLIACKAKTKDDIVKDNIKSYLSKTMNDFKSYEPVEYGPLDSIITTYDKTPRFDSLKSIFDGYLSESKKATDNAKIVAGLAPYTYKLEVEKSNSFNGLADSILSIMKIEDSLFKPEFLGFKTKHSYRNRNENGATVLTSEYFYMKKDLTVVYTQKADIN